MKKALTPLLLLSLAVLFGMTWYCSVQAEKYFNAEVAAINRVLPPAIRMKVESYQRSLFSAEAETQVIVGGRELIRLHHLLRHYVWGVDMFSTLASGSPLATEIGNVLPLESLQLESHITLQGQFKSDFDLTNGGKRGGDGSAQALPYHFVWSGSGDFAAGQCHGHVELNLPVFTAGYRFYSNFRTGVKENPAVLNEQAEQLVYGLVQKGIFHREKEIFSIDFAESSGHRSTNGKPF